KAAGGKANSDVPTAATAPGIRPSPTNRSITPYARRRAAGSNPARSGDSASSYRQVTIASPLAPHRSPSRCPTLLHMRRRHFPADPAASVQGKRRPIDKSSITGKSSIVVKEGPRAMTLGVVKTQPDRPLRVIGLMSGTSGDGIDAALVE